MGLAAALLTGCTVATHSSGDYASLTIATDTILRGEICKTFSLIEERELLRQLDDSSVNILMINDHLVNKYGTTATMDCYAKVVGHYNENTDQLLNAINKEPLLED